MACTPENAMASDPRSTAIVEEDAERRAAAMNVLILFRFASALF
jgi:hypothetical protein